MRAIYDFRGSRLLIIGGTRSIIFLFLHDGKQIKRLNSITSAEKLSIKLQYLGHVGTLHQWRVGTNRPLEQSPAIDQHSPIGKWDKRVLQYVS